MSKPLATFLYLLAFPSKASKLSSAFPVPNATHDTVSWAIITFIPVFYCNNLSSPSTKHPPPVI